MAQQSLDTNETEELEFPEELPLLPVRDTVLFPHAVMPLNIGRESSISLVNSLGENKTLAVVTQRDPRIDSPEPDDLYELGVLAIIHKAVRMPNNSLLIFCEGIDRIRVSEFVATQPYHRIRYERLVEVEHEPNPEMEALRQNATSMFHDVVELSPAAVGRRADHPCQYRGSRPGGRLHWGDVAGPVVVGEAERARNARRARAPGEHRPLPR